MIQTNVGKEIVQSLRQESPALEEKVQRKTTKRKKTMKP